MENKIITIPQLVFSTLWLAVAIMVMLSIMCPTSYAQDTDKMSREKIIEQIKTKRAQLIANGFRAVIGKTGEKSTAVCIFDKVMFCAIDANKIMCLKWKDQVYFLFTPARGEKLQLPMDAIGLSSNEKIYPYWAYRLIPCGE